MTDLSINQIICGDCLDMMRGWPNECVDLVVTSPPYNIGKEYEKVVDLGAYTKWQEEIIRECHRISRSNGSICWVVGNYVEEGRIIPLDTLIHPIFDNLGMKLRNRVVWFFRHGLHSRHRFSGRYEVVLWYTKSDDYTFNLDEVRVPQLWPKKKAYKGPRKGQYTSHPLGKNPSDVWEDVVWDVPHDVWHIRNVHSNIRQKTTHPAQFPEELVERLVKALSNEGDLVFDPFVGSGTTCAVAKRLGRHFIGIDLNPDYCEIARKRCL